MIPYSRPKLSDLYTLSQSKLLENHNLQSGTYLYSPYMAVSPPPPPWGRIFASKGLCTSRGGYPCARVTLASGLKIARIYEQIFTGRVTTRLHFASFTGVFRYA